jgi:hypothetical protein
MVGQGPRGGERCRGRSAGLGLPLDEQGGSKIRCTNVLRRQEGGVVRRTGHLAVAASPARRSGTLTSAREPEMLTPTMPDPRVQLILDTIFRDMKTPQAEREALTDWLLDTQPRPAALEFGVLLADMATQQPALLKQLKPAIRAGSILIDATVPLAASVGGRASRTIGVSRTKANSHRPSNSSEILRRKGPDSSTVRTRIWAEASSGTTLAARPPEITPIFRVEGPRKAS